MISFFNNFFLFLLRNSIVAFCVLVKALSHDFGTELS